MSNDDLQLSTLLLSVVPESLLDVEKTISLSRSQSIAKANALCEVYRNCEKELDNLEQHCSDAIIEQQKKLKQIAKEKKHIEEKLQTFHKEKIELEEKIRRNKALCEEIVVSDTEDEELSEIMKQVCTQKAEIEAKKRDIRHDISKFKKGIKYYNKYLQCNVLVDEGNMVVFTPNVSAKNVSDVKDYIKFITSDGVTFHYVEMQPILQNEHSLVKRFQETGDTQGLIVSFLKDLGLFKGKKSNEL